MVREMNAIAVSVFVFMLIVAILDVSNRILRSFEASAKRTPGEINLSGPCELLRRRSNSSSFHGGILDKGFYCSGLVSLLVALPKQ